MKDLCPTGRDDGSGAAAVSIDLPRDPAPPRPLRPRIVPFFLPHAGCPHRCAFCDQHAITQLSPTLAPPDPEPFVKQWLSSRPDNPEHVQLAFYGGNFLGLPPVRLQALLEAARRLIEGGWIGSLRFSTRPDTVDPERLAWLRGLPIACVELGVQSMDDGVLAACRRGHTASQTEAAAVALKIAGYPVGMQMMIGLPGEEARSALVSGARIARLAPSFVRIYPCLVLAQTPLAEWYHQGRYCPLSLEQAVTIAKRLWRLFAHRGIPVIRMGLQAAPEIGPQCGLVAGPYHPAFGHLVHSAICYDALALTMKKLPTAGRSIEITVHPNRLSCVRGLKNANIQKLTTRFEPAEIRVSVDPGLPAHRMRLCLNAVQYRPARKRHRKDSGPLPDARLRYPTCRTLPV